MTIGSRPASTSLDPETFSFVDLSNIWYGLRGEAQSHGEEVGAIRIMAAPLAAILRAGRVRFTQIAVANADVPPSVIAYFEREGEVIRRESGRQSGTEQANDETLQVRMYEAMHQHPSSVMVLATGDGAGWRQRHGFIPALEAARGHKWGVEVVSWGGIANAELVQWVRRVGGAFVDLNDHYYSVSFVEHGRRVQPVSLLGRPTADLRGRSKH